MLVHCDPAHVTFPITNAGRETAALRHHRSFTVAVRSVSEFTKSIANGECPTEVEVMVAEKMAAWVPAGARDVVEHANLWLHNNECQVTIFWTTDPA